MDDRVGRGFYRPERKAISTNRRAPTHPNSEGFFLPCCLPLLPNTASLPFDLAHAPNKSATTSSCVNSPSPRLSPLTRPSCPRRALPAGARHRRRAASATGIVERPRPRRGYVLIYVAALIVGLLLLPLLEWRRLSN